MINSVSEAGKLPPQSIELEEAVLGTMLQYPNALNEVFSLLNSESFYKPAHGVIFTSIKALYDSGKEANILTITEKLRSKGELQISGGPGYIAGLTNRITGTEGLEYHCFILKEKQIGRAQIAFAAELMKKAYDETDDVFDSIEFMSDEVFKIQNIGNVEQDLTNEELAQMMMQDIERAAKAEGITGAPTGFKEKDRLFGGWQDSDLIIQAARPGMGKTANMLCEVFNMAVLHGKTVMVFSLEMSAIQLFKRLASLATSINASKFKTGKMSADDWNVFHSRISQIITDKILIIDNCYTLSQIRNRAKKERMSRRVDCIYVDYLQIMEGTGKNQSREQEISSFSRGLKKCAKELSCPVIALSQLSRKVDDRPNKRPKLSDLRESGAIEQDADIVIFLYRPNYYSEATQGEEDVGWFIVAKHRNGSLMDIKLRYVHERTQFLDYESTELF